MNVGVRLIQAAGVYMVLSLLLGLSMAITKDFRLMSVHAHLGMLGWVTMGLAGVAYVLLPGCARSPLARVHFWGHNLGLPVMMASLVLYTLGSSAAEKVLAAGSTLVVASLLLFAVNLLRNARLDAAR